MDDYVKRNEVDQSRVSPLHTLGTGHNQAMPGDQVKDMDITGSRAGGAALVDVIAILVRLGATDLSVP